MITEASLAPSKFVRGHALRQTAVASMGIVCARLAGEGLRATSAHAPASRLRARAMVAVR